MDVALVGVRVTVLRGSETTMRSIRWLVVIALVVALPLPVAARPVAEPGQGSLERLDREMPAGARTWVARDGGAQRRDGVTGVLTGVRGYGDRQMWLETAAAAVQEVTGQPSAYAAEGPEDAEPRGRIVEGDAAGDLDGDGGDDVIALSYDVGSDAVTVQALRGADAGVLWQREIGEDGALVWPLGSDANGDGIDDVSVEGLTVHEEHVVEECEDFDGEQWCWPIEYRATFTWTVGVASGVDGRELWTRTFDGTVDEKTSESYGAPTPVTDEHGYRYELQSTNLYAFALSAGDLDGDGNADMVTDAIDLNVTETHDSTDAGAAWTDDASLQVRAATRAAVVNAADGGVRHTLADSAQGRISFLVPTDDIVAGPGPDLLWDTTVAPDQNVQCVTVDAQVDWVSACPDEYDGGFAVTVQLLDGATLEPDWTASVPDAWFITPVESDLNGDGRRELMAFSETADGYLTTVLSGADGATVWSQSADDWLFPMAFGQLDGAAGADLVTVMVAFGFDDESKIIVERRSGLTGAVLSATERSIPAPPDDANFVGEFVYAAGDADGDGDGIGDITTGFVQEAYRFDDETGEEELLALRSGGIAESGATGAVRRTLSLDGVATLLPTGDITGDNLTDLLEERYDPDRSSTWTASPFGPDAPLWTATSTSPYAFLFPAGDQDGIPGDELLRQTYDGDDTQMWSSLSSVSGRTGRDRWTMTTR